jgi:hypothetical protein
MRMTERVIIAQCTNQKRDGEHCAGDLYDESALFRKQAAYAEVAADRWFIQSAEYGLLRPTDVVESYDTHAEDLRDPEQWAAEIASTLTDDITPPATVELLGGAAYADPLTPELEALGFDVLEPLRGLGIGERMAELDARRQQEVHDAIVHE